MRGSTFRRCSCRGEDGKLLSGSCPKLKRRDHGVWGLRQELPNRPDGSRRSFSRSGYGGAAQAQADLDRVRALLALPEQDDTETVEQVCELLAKVAAEKSPLPDIEDVRRRLSTGQSLSEHVLLGEFLTEWIAGKRRRPGTLNGYQGHITNHLVPRLGHIRWTASTSATW